MPLMDDARQAHLQKTKHLQSVMDSMQVLGGVADQIRLNTELGFMTSSEASTEALEHLAKAATLLEQSVVNPNPPKIEE